MWRLGAAVTLIGVMLSGCDNSPARAVAPEPFGVTMVEETTCIGQGGRIAAAADGTFVCVMTSAGAEQG